MNGNDKFNLDDELMARAAKIPTSVSPSRDLWPDIEKAISTPAKPERRFWDLGLAQAAAVLILVGASSALTYTIVKDGDVAPITPIARDLNFQPVGSFGSQYNLGPDYQDVRRNLGADLEGADLEKELADLEPETRAEVVANVLAIRQAIEDINKALAEEPDNVLLQELLLNAYRDELSLMKTMDGISNAAMRRDDI